LEREGLGVEKIQGGEDKGFGVAECGSRFENVFRMEGSSGKVRCGGGFGMDSEMS